MTGDRTTRRRFIAAGGVAAAALAGAGAARLLGGGPKEALTGHVDEAIGSDAVRAVGRAYLGVRPAEDGETRLVRLLRSRPEWRSVSSPADARRALARAGRDDFAAGRLVSVDGWYLAESEARACALATFA